jgi:copper resistance protein C
MTAAIKRSAILGGALAVVCIASAAFAQARFVRAAPAAGSKVGSAPEVRLEFDESVAPRFSGLTLTAPHGVNIELGQPEVESGDPRVLVVPITNVLEPGAYTVSWLVVSFDNHSTRGEFSFDVKP